MANLKKKIAASLAALKDIADVSVKPCDGAGRVRVKVRFRSTVALH